jgi:hypothetical protein
MLLYDYKGNEVEVSDDEDEFSFEVLKDYASFSANVSASITTVVEVVPTIIDWIAEIISAF